MRVEIFPTTNPRKIANTNANAYLASKIDTSFINSKEFVESKAKTNKVITSRGEKNPARLIKVVFQKEIPFKPDVTPDKKFNTKIAERTIQISLAKYTKNNPHIGVKYNM